MSEEELRAEETHEMPEAVVSSRRHQISIVWFVPLVAILIGGWLVYKTLSEKAPPSPFHLNPPKGLKPAKPRSNTRTWNWAR